jgi:hypothetical protein
MLGGYHFNDILFFLNDNDYTKIYNRDFLITNKFDIRASHKLYKFIFNHDYITDHSEITNYDFIKDRFDIKIKNFKDMLVSENKSIFITFADSVDSLNIIDMLKWLNNNKKKFHFMIFTNNDYSNINNIKNLSIIKINQSYALNWGMEKEIQTSLYKEIYEKFIQCCLNENIENDFPKTFNETYYGKLK